MTHRRHALYFTCPDGPLAEAAAAWLGWDAARAEARGHPAIGLDAARITERPRRYGFHGTLKAPFRLAAGTSRAAVSEHLRAFGGARAPVTLPGMGVTRLGRFLALTPEGPSEALSALAGDCVRDFDHFRAPLTEEEEARRRAAGLSRHQEELLAQWGYPYVLEEFRFHMTLTGPLEDPAPVAEVLSRHFAPLLPRPFVIDAVSLCGERQDGRFEVLERVPLGG
ncbi:MAG: DUF1045 domain-containing protein [Pseudomonadota bacterium]